MNTRRHVLQAVRLVAAVFLFVCVVQASAEPPSEIVDSAAKLRTALENATALTDEQRQQAATRLDEALGFASERVTVETAQKQLRDTLDKAPARLKDLQAALDAAAASVAPPEFDDVPVAEIESRLTTRRAELAVLQSQLDERERRFNDLVGKSRSDAADLASVEQRAAELEAESAPENADDPLAAVDSLWRSARVELLRSRAALIKLRQANVDLLTELARRERDVAALRVEAAKNDVAALQAALQAKRKAQAEAVISAAAEQAGGGTAGMRAVQRDITGLVREQTGLVSRQAELERQLEQVNRTLERLKRDYERIRQVVELGGTSTQVSTLLQKRRRLAPSPEQQAAEVLELQQQISDAGLRQLELDERLQQLVDANAALAYLAAENQLDPDAIAAAGQAEAARDLAGLYRQSVLDLWQGYTRYLGVLAQLETSTRALVEEARRYQAFIDDRLLWVPSSELVPLDQPALLVGGLRWFADPLVIDAVTADIARLPVVATAATAFWLLGVVVLGMLRRRALDGLARCREVTQKVRTDRFSATLVALMHTVILLAWVPWILIGAGLLLAYLPAASNPTLMLAAGLQAAGQSVLFLGTLRHLCRSNGLARVHLNWNPLLCEQLGRQASWLMPFAVPLGFLSAAGTATVPSDFVSLAGSVQVEHTGLLALGRLAFATQMLLMAVAVYRIWRRQGKVMTALAENEESSKWASYHLLWFWPALLLPLSAAASALIGYFYTAVFLTSVGGVTMWFVILAVLARDLLFRGLYVTQRRLRFEEALRYRDELLAHRAAGGEPTEAPAETAIKVIEEEKISYSQLGDEVRKLVQLGFTVSLLVGLWWAWRDIFPALGFLNTIELPITTDKLIDGVSQTVPLTLGDMAAGLVLGGLALFAAMRVPAVLELTLLQRLPMSRASRYAVTTMTQYVVAVVGLVITFKSLGLQWSSIQWLVAALSVGLGFGLQEIVANFVSGIILLFEQPMRVGDIVTIDGNTGTVSKIRIRATTIVNWDRQELVIPNKTFITGQLINWTLTDQVNRVTINVGVSYATDTREAMRIMAEVADQHPQVLDDPPFRTTFENFGDNALLLVLRVYLANLDYRLQTITELHQAILDRYREAGIEIAFPQRDVHLSTDSPLELYLRRGGPTKA
jgi:potassium efflux system protein